MTGPDGDGPSFDPRTWGGAKPPAPPPPTGPESTSFNPRQWVSTPAETSPSGPRPPSRRTLWIGAGALSAIAVVVLGLVALGGHKATPRAAASGSVAATPAAAAPPPGTERRTMILGGASDLTGALVGAGVAEGEARQAAQTAASALGAAPGDLHLTLTLAPGRPHAKLVGLEARRDTGAGVSVSAKPGGGFLAQSADAHLATRSKVVRGEMDGDSFYTSAVAAGVSDSLISPFAQAFTFDFDFQREIKKGDIFEAVFEQQVDDTGSVVGGQKLVFALLETAARSRALYRFRPAGQTEGWFDANGASIVRSLMRTPVEGARISSTFGMREHPVLGFMKLHKGIDFASPVGTPIYAAGDGVVEFAGPKGPNGNFVQIRHTNGWETLYLHMSAFGPGITAGAHVRQGQQVGAVGTTGRSTGPHLHYEVHIAGEAVDPASIKTDAGRTLSGTDLAAFRKERDRIDALRAQQTGG